MSRRFLIIVLALGIGLPILLLAGLSMTSNPPDNLGVSGGQLAACPDSPNCVCTQASDEQHRMDPIPWSASTAAAMDRIEQVLQQMSRVKIVRVTDNYLHAEARSLIFRFVDDIEFLVDEESSLIHFRSASRSGYSDLGANRKRMEQFRDLFLQTP